MECPICTFKLRGGDTTGYRCLRCKAFFSAKFVRKMRRKLHSQRIHEHFGREVIEETQEAIIEVPQGLEGLIHRR